MNHVTLNLLKRKIYFKKENLKTLFYYKFRKFNNKKIKFAFTKDSISRIYVINLDKDKKRLISIKNELKRMKTNDNNLLSLTERISANDASKYSYKSDKNDLKNYYYLSDHLKVQPCIKYLVNTNDNAKIKMTKPEIGCALSHIDIWKRIVKNNNKYCLILEDDVFFTSTFNNKIDKIWYKIKDKDFDILYLSFSYAEIDTKKKKTLKTIIKAETGIWKTSGYILSKEGAKKLLKLLPIYGPVDLWLNLNFDKLNVYTTKYPIIIQRTDLNSNNNYSILSVWKK